MEPVNVWENSGRATRESASHGRIEGPRCVNPAQRLCETVTQNEIDVKASESAYLLYFFLKPRKNYASFWVLRPNSRCVNISLMPHVTPLKIASAPSRQRELLRVLQQQTTATIEE